MQNKEIKTVNVYGQKVEIFDSTTHQLIENNLEDVVTDEDGNKWQLQEDWYHDNYCGTSWVKIS